LLCSAAKLRERCASQRCIKPKRLSNASYLQQTLALQTRALQLDRQKIRVEKEKLEVLKTISTELSALRTLYSAAHGIEVIAPECIEQ